MRNRKRGEKRRNQWKKWGDGNWMKKKTSMKSVEKIKGEKKKVTKSEGRMKVVKK